jgi:hypothetical protein
MVREATNTSIKKVVIGGVHALTGRTRTGPRTAVPTSFVAEVLLERPALVVWMSIEVPQGGVARITELKLYPDGVPTITPGAVRAIALDTLLRAALAAAEQREGPITPRTDIGSRVYQLPTDPPDRYRASPPMKSRVQERADENAGLAAQIYMDALAQGSRAPAEAVATALDRSRGQVARYIRRARELGLLPPLGEATSSHSESRERLQLPAEGTQGNQGNGVSKDGEGTD